MIDALLRDPLFNTAGLPAIVAFLTAGFFRLAGGPNRGTTMAGIGIAFGMLAAYLLIQGAPPFPPISSSQKLPYLIVGGLALAAVAQAAPKRIWVAYGAIVIAVLATVFWFGLPRVKSLDTLWALDRNLLFLSAGCAIAGLLVLYRLYRQRQFGGDASVLLGVAAVALAPIALFSNSASYAQMSGALAAAIGGFFLWNWPRPRFPLGLFGVLGAGVTLLALATGLLRFAAASPWPFLLLLPVFFADTAANRLGFLRDTASRWYRPLFLAGIAAVPAATAVATAYGLAGQSLDSGY